MTMPLEREAILPRINGIRENLVKLGAIRNQGVTVLAQQGPEFDLAQHYLRLTLEGVFNITGHILSRLPGGRATEYKEMARKLGAHGVVDRTFAEERLVPMAGMRNLLVHHYSDLDPQRLYDVLAHHLDDVETFLHAVKVLIEHPEKFGLTIA